VTPLGVDRMALLQSHLALLLFLSDPKDIAPIRPEALSELNGRTPTEAPLRRVYRDRHDPTGDSTGV